MKTINNIIKNTDRILTKWSTSYIHSVSKTLYPRPHLEKDNNDDNDDEPMLFI